MVAISATSVTASIAGASAPRYYLTGGHFFGTASKDSITDYFAEDTPKVRADLVSKDFVLDSEAPPGSIASLRAIYKHEKLHVIVQLRNDVGRHLLLQGILRKYECGPLMKHKPLQNVVWALATECFEMGVRHGRNGRD